MAVGSPRISFGRRGEDYCIAVWVNFEHKLNHYISLGLVPGRCGQHVVEGKGRASLKLEGKLGCGILTHSNLVFAHPGGGFPAMIVGLTPLSFKLREGRGTLLKDSEIVVNAFKDQALVEVVSEMGKGVVMMARDLGGQVKGIG